MNRHEALNAFDALSEAGKEAVRRGTLADYLLAMDPETLVEQITQEIATAGPDTWKHLQACYARRDMLGIGMAVIYACANLRATYEAERAELSGWIQQEADDAMTMRSMPRGVA